MAPVITHKQTKLVKQPNNLPPYVWYGECACGFATRMATEELAKSQLDAHLTAHGVVPSVLGSVPASTATDDSGKTKGSWVPLGAKPKTGG